MSALPTTAKLKDPPSDLENELLAHVKGLVRMSRDARSPFYSEWDSALLNFEGKRRLDKDDEKAAKRDEPVKMVIPLTRAQIQSYISFNWLLMSQNRTFYELEPTGDEDALTRPDCEKVLQRDCQANQWAGKVVQFLLDQCLCGHGVLDCSWEECYYRYLTTLNEEPGNYFGVEIAGATGEQEVKVLAREGNKVTCISPYRWFPDTRLPLNRYQEGEFVATEDEISKSALRKLEAEGLVSDVSDIPEMTADKWKDRGTTRLDFMSKFFASRMDGSVNSTGAGLSNSSNTPKGMYVLTRVQVDITPKDFMFKGKSLGTETWPVRYVVWYANDQKIIRCERLNALHGKFTQVCGEFTPNHHQLCGQGLAEVLDKMQHTVSWLVSSHIRAVTNVINNKVVVDPAGVNMKSLEDPQSPFILLNKNASRQGVDRWVQQLKVQDTTAGHMQDAQLMAQMMQVVTGINDNAQGQYNSGRRSATEARAVTAGAAGRLKTHAELNWTSVFQPLGHMMLTNSRQMLSLESFMRICGRPKPGEEQIYLARFTAFKSTLEDLVGGDDFFVFDSTLSSEKGFIAQSLQELWIALITNPAIALSLGIDARAMLKEIMFLRGVTNFSRFDLPANIATGQTLPPTQPNPTENGPGTEQPGTSAPPQ